MKKRVFVGLSGGVDSAVSAALLKRGGYDVVGAFIKIWQPEFTECTWREDRLDAMRVAAALDIPFREIDLSDEYKKEVVCEILHAYERGFTPNPDVLCNSRIKFGFFAGWAFTEGADAIATGHYARVEERSGDYSLMRGLDRSKDQSYFLWQLTQAELSRVLFPVGALQKRHVRVLAREYGLPNAAKSDSQGLCFVGDISMRDFLQRYITVERGEVLNEEGRTIGSHAGAALYTIGQRHGFSVEGVDVSQKPHYVIATDTQCNTIVVSPLRLRAARLSVELHDTSWVSHMPTQPFSADVVTRYREQHCSAVIEPGEPSALVRVTFRAPHVCALGQSLVIYDGDRLLGGGIMGSRA